MRMKNRRICNRISALAAMMALMCVMGAPFADARTDAAPTVRVAYPIQNGLTEVDEDGHYSGYTFEYLQEIAQYTGWNYEFVQIPGDMDESLNTLMDMLESGEVDLMGGTLYSEALAETYSYSGYSYGTVYTVLQSLMEDTRDMVVDSQTQQTMRIAVPKSSKYRLQEMTEYCELNRITPELVLCEDGAEQMKALQEGRADVMLNTSLNWVEGLRTIARFAPKPFYFIMSKKSDQGLMQDLNAALINIEQADPYFATSLHEKYFSPPPDKLLLSETESAYIHEAGELRVGVLTDQPPYQSYDEGNYRGIAIDFLHHIAEETGLRFTYVPVSGQDQLDHMIETGAIDLVAGMTYDYEEAQTQGLSMTRPYLSVSYILLINRSVSEDSLKGKRQAIVQNRQDQASETLLTYDTISDCVRAVDAGKADYTYVDAYTGQYYINHPEFNDLKAISQIEQQRQICFGIVKRGNSELLSVLNKVIAVISTEDMQSFVYSNTLYNQHVTLATLFAEYPLESVLVIVAVLLVVMGILFYAMWQRMRANKQAAVELKKHLQVYALTNDYFFEYDFRAETLMLSMPAKDGSGSSTLKTYAYSGMDRADRDRAAMFLQLIHAHEDGTKEALLPCDDGASRWFRITMKTVLDSVGTPVYAVGKITDIDYEKQEQDKLKDQARRDSLTGLLNTGACRDEIAHALATMPTGTMSALILLDVDYFKSINDQYGHMQGDQVLRRVAAILRDSFRSDDIVGRPGGDEFTVYMRNIKDGAVLTEKCAMLTRRVNDILLEDGRRLSISIGAATALPGTDYAALYQAADQALYSAKANGRDRYEFGTLR